MNLMYRLRWFIIIGGVVLLLVAFAVVYYMTSNRRRKSIVNKTSPDDVSNILRELAHEIRNPLNSMLLNLVLVEEYLTDSYELPDTTRRQRRGGDFRLDGAENPAYSSACGDKTCQPSPYDMILDKLGVVRAEIEQLDNFLSDLQKYARLQKPKPEECDIGILIAEVLDFIEPETQLQNIELSKEIEESLPVVKADRRQFKQALLNLIINANQAMANGGKLTVAAKNLNGQIRIDVKDTGIGIPPGKKDEIFNLFTTTKEEGTGVGLAIVKRIVEEHGGEIKVNSILGEGTTFSIFLEAEKHG